jgi:hypothetical protein
VFSQCYINTNYSTEGPYFQDEVVYEEEEESFNEFFNTKIEFMGIEDADGFCYKESFIDTIDARFILGNNLLIALQKDSISKSPIYAHLLAYHHQSLNKSNLSMKDKELQADLLAGYYYCYQSITKNWDTLERDVPALIKKSNDLNRVMDAYIELYKNYFTYDTDENLTRIDLKDRKTAFLTGTYFAMPPGYRMYVSSDAVIGNDIALLFEEVNKNLNDNNFAYSPYTPKIELKDIEFRIIKKK